MGEAKRRQKYWANQGQTPPPQRTKSSTKTKANEVHQNIGQIKADTNRVKLDSAFKRKCQETLADENRNIKKRVEGRDFALASDIIATIQERSHKLSAEQVELWMDYLISGLLDTKNIEPVQAQLFVWELESHLQLNATKTQKDYRQLSEKIAATTAYLKSLEVWVDINNDLLSIYQVGSAIH